MEQPTGTLEVTNVQQSVQSRRSKIFKRYLWWVGANAIGFGFGPTISILPWINLDLGIYSFTNNYSKYVDDTITLLSILLMFFSFGIVLGLCHWLGLRERKSRLFPWLVLNGLAWVFFPKIWYLFSFMSYLPLTVAFALVGLSIGILQGIAQSFLIHKVNRRAWWWLLATIIGYIGGFAAFAYLGLLNSQADSGAPDNFGLEIAFYFLIPILGIVYGVFSGLFLIWPIRWFETPTVIASEKAHNIVE